MKHKITYSVPEIQEHLRYWMESLPGRENQVPVVNGTPTVVAGIAEACHEANRVYQHMTNDPAKSLPWDFVSDEMKQSAIQGVEEALKGATPEELHDSWCKAKEAAGWVYGPDKDSVKKTHPCLVPYSELPVEQRRKDHLFRAIVNALTEEID